LKGLQYKFAKTRRDVLNRPLSDYKDSCDIINNKQRNMGFIEPVHGQQWYLLPALDRAVDNS
jgi:hypothetical protein